MVDQNPFLKFSLIFLKILAALMSVLLFLSINFANYYGRRRCFTSRSGINIGYCRSRYTFCSNNRDTFGFNRFAFKIYQTVALNKN